MGDPQFTIGTSMSDILATMERDGRDPATISLGINAMLRFVYDYLPEPPVFPTASLSLAGASWVPDGVDRISRLHDVVLRDIISRLSAKEAARTAALSSRWRPLWRSAPPSLFDIHLFPDGDGDASPSPRAVTAAVSSVLTAHPGPFRSVHLICSAMDKHRGEMARWLDILVAKGVQELVFVNSPWTLDLRLPATLFSCASLTRLYLGIWRLPDTAAVPRGASFPNLRELGLCWNVMEDRDLAFMLERSPVLEFLVIMGSQTGVRVRLVNHSLRCVQLGFSFMEDIDVVDAPRLQRLLQWEAFSAGNSRVMASRSFRIKIGNAPNLRVLGYLQPGEQELVVVAGSKEKIVPSVQILAMEVQFGARNAVKKVPHFLRCFPNLETLHVYSPRISEKSTVKVNLKFWQEGGPIKCVMESMKKLLFYEFRGSRSEVAFLKFIAERGRVLEQMVVVVASEYFSSGDNVNAKLKPLADAKWSSKACKLELFRSPFEKVSGPPYSHEIASDFGFADPFDLQYYSEAEMISVS